MRKEKRYTKDHIILRNSFLIKLMTRYGLTFQEAKICLNENVGDGLCILVQKSNTKKNN